MPRVAAIIVNMVPYHHARWEAFAGLQSMACDLIEQTDRDEFDVLEFSKDSTYRRHTLFPRASAVRAVSSNLHHVMTAMLSRIKPDVLCVSGWGLPVSLAAIAWAAPRGVPLVMLSESNEFDEPRIAWKEFIKRRIVSLCSAGVGGGNPQADYLVKLGLPRELVFTGYDVVDIDYFETKAKEFQHSGFKFAGAAVASQLLRQVSGFTPSRPYFLACARFGKKKNLPGLIRAYSCYREKSRLSTLDFAGPAVASHPLRRLSTVFDLVIAGDGEERVEIERTIRKCGVSDHVHLVGAKGYYDLPAYYANAGAFIHASTTEQWGLVVNEAMASGLPVLVSNRCGCAADLVKEGVNGWTFDPTNEEQMADLMLRISSDEEQRKEMGAKSREIISEWGPERFAKGIESAVKAALAAPSKKVGLLERLILWVMTRR